MICDKEEKRFPNDFIHLSASKCHKTHKTGVSTSLEFSLKYSSFFHSIVRQMGGDTKQTNNFLYSAQIFFSTPRNNFQWNKKNGANLTQQGLQSSLHRNLT